MVNIGLGDKLWNEDILWRSLSCPFFRKRGKWRSELANRWSKKIILPYK